MRFSIHQETRQGTRRSNQDRVGYACSREALLMVVADGLGGHLRGEVAAQIAVQYLTGAFRRQASPLLANPPQFLLDAFLGAHSAISRYAREHELPESPRTTCVACVVQRGMAYWAHAGDSRLYHLRDGRVNDRTRDHSRVQALVDTGRIREEAMSRHPARNRVVSCLGSAVMPLIDFSRPTLLRQGDTLLLCSDGVWGPLPPGTIPQAMCGADLAKDLHALLDLAEGQAGRDCDNLSAVAMTWGEDTVTLPLDLVTRTVELTAAARQGASPGGGALDGQPVMTDEEMDEAIREIRAAIRRNSNKIG